MTHALQSRDLMKALPDYDTVAPTFDYRAGQMLREAVDRLDRVTLTEEQLREGQSHRTLAAFDQETLGGALIFLCALQEAGIRLQPKFGSHVKPEDICFGASETVDGKECVVASIPTPESFEFVPHHTQR